MGGYKIAKEKLLYCNKGSYKGEAVVVMNKNHYHKIVVKMLQDEETYKKPMKIVTKKVFKDLEKLVAGFSNCLLKEEENFLCKISFSSRTFYGLPKVHKTKIIQEAIQVQNSEYIKKYELSDLTFRPNVAVRNCPTRRLSNLQSVTKVMGRAAV